MDVKCPKCGSTQIHANKQGFKTGRAVVGTLIAGPLLGLATGGAGKNKIVITCLGCGHQFKPGEGDVSCDSHNLERENSEFAEYNCRYCGTFSSFREPDKRCPSCGASVVEVD